MDQDLAGAPLCTVCGTRLTSNDRYCPNCGTPNPNYAPATPDQQTERLSPPAGQDVTPPPPPAATTAATGWPPPPEPGRQGGNRNTWLIIGIIALVFVAICCCCVLLVAVASSSDNAFREELEGVARLAGSYKISVNLY